MQTHFKTWWESIPDLSFLNSISKSSLCKKHISKYRRYASLTDDEIKLIYEYEYVGYTYPSFAEIVEEAKFLIDEGTNTEYVRGVLEIICSFYKCVDDSCHADKVIDLATAIGLDQSVIDKLY